MDIQYNKNEIAAVLTDVSLVIGTPISFFDKDMRLIATPKSKNMTEFCSLIRSTECGEKACALSDEDGCKKCLDSGQSVTYRCHAGICETITPVKNENLIIGYIIFGQYRLERQEYDISAFAKKNGLDECVLLEKYEALQTFSYEKIQSICRILQSCILGFYLKGAVSIIRSELSDKIKTYVENNVSEKLTVEKLCAEFFINKKQLYTIFKQNFNKTVKQYLFDVQILKAKQLLSSTELSVTEIAEKTGFSDYNNFIQRFKKAVGLTPLRYRNRCKEPKPSPQ